MALNALLFLFLGITGCSHAVDLRLGLPSSVVVDTITAQSVSASTVSASDCFRSDSTGSHFKAGIGCGQTGISLQAINSEVTSTAAVITGQNGLRIIGLGDGGTQNLIYAAGDGGGGPALILKDDGRMGLVNASDPVADVTLDVQAYNGAAGHAARFGFGAKQSTFTSSGSLQFPRGSTITFSGGITFSTAASVATAGHGIVIDASNNIGVGIVAPTSVFHVNRTNYGGTMVTLNALSGSANNILDLQTFTNSASNYLIRARGNNGSTSALWVGTSGQIGMGTDSPGRPVNIITAPTSQQTAISMSAITGTLGNLLDLGNQAPSSNGHFTLRVRGNISSTATQFVINTNGRVGVGTSTPTASVHISSGATSPYGLYIDGSSQVPLQINSSTFVFIVRSSGAVGIGTTSPAEKLHVRGISVSSQIYSGFSKIEADLDAIADFDTPFVGASDNDGGSSAVLLSNGGNGADGGRIVLAKTGSAGATDANTAVQSGDQIGQLDAYGADGATYRPAASIWMSVDGTPGSGDMPGNIQFRTTPDGTATGRERLRIDNRGHFVNTSTAPAIGSGATDCGTTPAISGNDRIGYVTVGSGVNGGKCTITFNAQYDTAPVCFAQNNTTANLVRAAATTTAKTELTGTFIAGDTVSYLCEELR